MRSEINFLGQFRPHNAVSMHAAKTKWPLAEEMRSDPIIGISELVGMQIRGGQRLFPDGQREHWHSQRYPLKIDLLAKKLLVKKITIFHSSFLF